MQIPDIFEKKRKKNMFFSQSQKIQTLHNQSFLYLSFLFLNKKSVENIFLQQTMFLVLKIHVFIFFEILTRTPKKSKIKI